jgi:hypothetical protein
MKTRAIQLAVAAAVTAVGATAAAQPASSPQMPTHAVVRHVPPSEVAPGVDLRLLAIIDDAWVEDGLIARYRVAGRGGAWHSAPFERSTAGGTYATIPAEAVERPGVEYYIAGQRSGRAHFASAGAPHVVRVEPEPSQRWIEVEHRRLDGRLYAVAASFEVQDFGDNSGRDRYLRGEVDWTYRLVGAIYSITIGYGMLEGETPSSGDEDTALQLDRAVRWGQGGFRLRLGRALWFDARAMLGLGESGFLAGGGGQVILGDDWRTCVKIGGDWLEELSYRGWITLQWDTVPPFLMSATVATIDQPDARIDTGSTVRYMIELPIGDRLRIGAHTSFAARGNRPGWFGGGLSTQLDF